MTTTKSYSEKSKFFSLYKSSLKSQLSFGIVLTILLTILVPVVFFVSRQPYYIVASASGEDLPYILEQFRTGIYLADGQAGVVLFFLMVMAVVTALFANSHLHSKKMADLYHSLPVKREQMLTANMLASFTTILVPYLLVGAVTMILQLITYRGLMIGYGNYYLYMVVDVLTCVTAVAAVYLFTTLISVNVGTLFDSFALTGVIGFLPIGVYVIARTVWSVFTYGAENNIPDFVLNFSPFTFVIQRYIFMGYESFYDRNSEGLRSVFLLLAVWLVISAALYCATVWCYKRRKSEMAEQTQPSGVLQTMAKCFGALCGGMVFLAIFQGTHNLIVWMVAMVAGAVLIGIIAELILSRGFHSMKKNIKWLVATGVLCCLMVVGADQDFIGYTRRVPQAANVASVQIAYEGRLKSLSDASNDWYGSYGYQDVMLTQPESIAVVAEAHRMAVENRPPKPYEYEEIQGVYSRVWKNISYTMKNGSTMDRSFDQMYQGALDQLIQLENKEDVLRQRHALFFLEEKEGVSVKNITLYSRMGMNGKPYNLPKADTDRLLAAARLDMLAEPLDEITTPSAPAVGILEVQYQVPQDEYSPTHTANCRIIISREYTNTLAVLRELNLLADIDQPVEADEVRIDTLIRHRYTNRTVEVLLPMDIPGIPPQQIGVKEVVNPATIVSTDAGEIRQALASGRNQMLPVESSDADMNAKGAVVVLFLKDGEQLGAQLVRIDDLPEGLRSKLQPHLDGDQPMGTGWN